MDKECIICRTTKSDFNEEHIIPKTIGGGFIIHSVCSRCNKSMGDNIDTPFVNLKQILLHRHNYGLQRAYRYIRNPLTGKHFTNDGNAVIVKNDGKGFYYDFVPNMQIIQTENGVMGKLTMAEKFMNSEEEMIKKYSKKFEIQTGLPVGFYKIEKNTNSSPVTITITDSNNDFIFGCLKIAYETAVTCIPKYYTDELAFIYSKMLELGILNKNYAEFINPQQRFLEELVKHPAINNFHCAIIIGNIEPVGLVAVLKIFDMRYSLILSKKTDYIDNRMLLFLNDSIKEKMYYSVLKNLVTFEFSFNNNCLSTNHWAGIEKHNNIISEIFLNEKKEVPLYNEKGEAIAEHIVVLHSASNWNIDLWALSSIQKFNLKLSEGFFIKSLKSNLLYELAEINFNY